MICSWALRCEKSLRSKLPRLFAQWRKPSGKRSKGAPGVGHDKYGVTMMRSDLDLQDWLRLAQEEVMDLAVYLERIQIMLKEGK